MKRYKLTDEDLESLEPEDSTEEYMANYRLSEEDLEAIEDNKISLNADVDSKFCTCDVCGKKGELDICLSCGTFIHSVQKNSMENSKEDHPWEIYCGYGSPWDMFCFLLRDCDKSKLSGKNLCEECLARDLKKLDLVLVYEYFNGNYLLYTGKDLTSF